MNELSHFRDDSMKGKEIDAVHGGETREECSGWRVGTARDSGFFRQPQAAGLGDGPIYREAYTS
jgi:hypothetical protein